MRVKIYLIAFVLVGVVRFAESVKGAGAAGKATKAFNKIGKKIGKFGKALVEGQGDGQAGGQEIAKPNFNVDDKIMKTPGDLIGKDEAREALAALKATGARKVTFQRLQGFEGIKEFEPSGWKVEVQKQGGTPAKVSEGEKQSASLYPMGVGMALMNGCFGNNYKKGDPCYDFARISPLCHDQIDAANFLGVGFDGRGFYSAESRKKSVIQRTCAGKAKFMDKDVPDCMNAFGIYDYSVHTETFKNSANYIRYLQEKAATSEQQAMFQMEAKAVSNGQNFGVNLGLIGSLIGQAKGGPAGAQVGEQIGSSIGFGTGSGAGSASAKSKGSRESNIKTSQSSSSGAGSARQMIAILEADLKLYELVLDELKPNDLNINLLSEILQLPTSYFNNNADVKFQNFILRWGTHFVKAAKFGGEMRIMKTSRKESTLSSDEFAAAAQSEFAGMMGVLRSRFQQRETRWGFLGLGGKHVSRNQQASAAREETARAKINQKMGGTQSGSQSEFIKTTINVRGGNPEIAAAITEFYTPQFRELFTQWLDSIDDYVRPFEFTLGKLSSILDMNIESLFGDDKSKSGCFQPAGSLKNDPVKGLTYFESVITVVDKDKNKIPIKRRNYCKYGSSKQKFMDRLLQAKLALERAETFYMAEGPFSTSNFDMNGGRSGCESDIIDYVQDGVSQTKTWPKLISIKHTEFKVVFNMRYDLKGVPKDAEYYVKFFNHRWFTKYPRTKYLKEFSCANSGEENEICVANLPLIYDETTGYLTINEKKFKRVAWWLKGPVASIVSVNQIKELEANIGSIGFVPCKLKWTNSHKIQIGRKESCIYFQGASMGNIYLVSAGVPQDYRTWNYIRISPSGVSFFSAMRTMQVSESPLSATLGEETLFTVFFVCFSKPNGRLRIDYGKAPEDKEVGIVLSSFIFPKPMKFDSIYFTFGAGEKKISVSDVRVVNEKPKIECGEGLILINGRCELKCHEECIGCKKANDRGRCIKCKNQKIYSKDGMLCLKECDASMKKDGKKCICKPFTAFDGKKCEALKNLALSAKIRSNFINGRSNTKFPQEIFQRLTDGNLDTCVNILISQKSTLEIPLSKQVAVRWIILKSYKMSAVATTILNGNKKIGACESVQDPFYEEVGRREALMKRQKNPEKIALSCPGKGLVGDTVKLEFDSTRRFGFILCEIEVYSSSS